MNVVRTLLQREEGSETVEYALLTGLILLATITLSTAIVSWVHNNCRFP